MKHSWIGLSTGLWLIGCSSSSFTAEPGDSQADSSPADSATDDVAADAADSTSAEVIMPEEAGPPVGNVCKDKPDGEACTVAGLTGRLCFRGDCVPTRCGDGFLSPGEECDNISAGCDSTCHFLCKEDKDCDDGNVCGAETCDTTLHVCNASKNAPDLTTCKLADGSDGRCASGLCKAAGCGNGAVDKGEDCDDKTPGCRSDCKWVCAADDACGDGNLCNGIETCDLTSHTCKPGTTVVCVPGKSCTKVECDGGTGLCIYPDVDGDGETCLTDCDESSTTGKSRSTKFKEECDGIDNNCDGKVDNDVATVTCFPDADGDTYGVTASSYTSCKCKPGDVQRAGDCNDSKDGGGSSVNPSVTSYYPIPFKTPTGTSSFDYNCNGVVERQSTNVLKCGDNTTEASCLGTREGWSLTVPGCGEKGLWLPGCNWAPIITIGSPRCTPQLRGSTVVQQCR